MSMGDSISSFRVVSHNSPGSFRASEFWRSLNAGGLVSENL